MERIISKHVIMVLFWFFVFSFSEHLLSTYHILGTFLDAGDSNSKALSSFHVAFINAL